MNTKTPIRTALIRLTAKEHLYHLSGIQKGISEGLAIAADQLEKAAANYVKTYEDAAKAGDEKCKEAMPAINQQADQYRAVAKQLSDLKDRYVVESNKILDRAYNSAEPSSLRNRLKRVIISATGAWKEG